VSFSSAELVCKKCGATFYTMRTLKSVRDVVRLSNNRCAKCTTVLNSADFTISVGRR
jgi:hypothetical protein